MKKRRSRESRPERALDVRRVRIGDSILTLEEARALLRARRDDVIKLETAIKEANEDDDD